MICKCPQCESYCTGITGALSNAGINTVNKVTDGIGNIRKQIDSSALSVLGMGKAIIDSASAILDWETFYRFECENCGNKWTIKEADAADETDDYFNSRETRFAGITGRRILTINPEADCIYPADSSITLLRSVPDGIKLPDNKYHKGEIYISHPADNTVFFPSTSYRYDVMKDELDDVIVYLQKLGAKSIRIKGKEQADTRSGIQSFLKTAIGVQNTESVSDGRVSYSSAKSDSRFNRLTRKYSKEIKSELLHLPVVDEVLLAKWGPIRKEWHTLAEMREHGIVEYDFELSSASISSASNTQSNRIEAEYRELCVKTSASVSREVIRSLREESYIGFNIHVEFYPASEYERFRTRDNFGTSLLKKLFKI